MSSAGTVTIDFAAETARFRAELERVNNRLRGVEQGFKGLEKFATGLFAGASIAAVVGFITSSADAADQLGKTADRLNIATERLTVFQIAAKNTGIEVDTANKLLQESQKRLGEASTGQGAAAKTLESLGLKYKDLKDLSPDELFIKYGDAIAKLGTRQEQAAATATLFGKAGVESLGFILQGREALDEASGFVDKFGLALSRVDIAQIEAAGDSVENLGHIAQGAGQRIAVGLSPFVLAFTESIAEATGSTTFLQDAVSVLGGAGYVGLQIFANAAKVLEATFFGIAGAAARAFSFVTFGDVSESLKASAEVNLGKADAALQTIKTEEQILKGLEDIYENSRVRAEEALAKNAAAAKPTGTLTLSTEFEGDLGLSEQQKNEAKLLIEDDYNKARIEGAEAVSKELARIQGEEVLIHADRNAAILEDDRRRIEAKQALESFGFASAVSLLGAFAQKSKTAAKAQVAIDKARALAQAIVNTKAGITLQLTSGDPYTRVPRAIAVGAFGALQIAAIIKTGFNEIGNIDSGGGPSLGSPTNPVFTDRPENAPGNIGSVPTAGGGPAQQRGQIQVVINGNFFSGRETINYLVDKLREEINDKDIVLFSPTSQQAQSLVPP